MSIFIDQNGEKYSYSTMTTSHKVCMEKLKAKQKWEAMSRLGVLLDWPDIICKKCQKIMNFKLITKHST